MCSADCANRAASWPATITSHIAVREAAIWEAAEATLDEVKSVTPWTAEAMREAIRISLRRHRLRQPQVAPTGEVDRLTAWLRYIEGNFSDHREAAAAALRGEPAPEATRQDAPAVTPPPAQARAAPLRLVLCDLNAALVGAWANAFAGIGAVEFWNGSIFDRAPADAIVSPANSFGDMGGGIDLAYVRRWGWNLQANLQRAIWMRGNGQSHSPFQRPPAELPVGEAVVVPTFADDVRWMIAAPTMRTPGPVTGTQNAYLAMRAALAQAKFHRFERVLCPGLGTLSGRIPPDEAARQMRRAWDAVMEAAAA